MEPIDPKIKQPKNTGFTNISDIVRANRQNRLGSAVSSGVQKTVGQGQKDLSGIKEQFQKQSQAGAVGSQADKQYVEQTLQSAGSVPSVQQTDIDKFARLRSGQYEGPRGLGNQEQLQARQQDLQDISNASTNQYGQRGLLQRFIGQPDYTQGQQRLDSLLLGQTGAKGLRQARQAAGQFGRELTGAERGAEAEAQGLIQQSRQFGQQVGQDIGTTQEALNTQLELQKSQAQTKSDAARNALKALLSKPSQTPGEMTTMPVGGYGHDTITQDQYDLAMQALIGQNGLDLNAFGYGSDKNFFTENPDVILGSNTPQATLQNTATEQNKLRSIALAKLAGQIPTDFTEESKVGSYNPLEFLNRENLNKFLKENEASNTFDASSINQASDSQLGTWNKSTLMQQGQAINNLAKQLENTDPTKAARYRDLANQLNAYSSGGKGYLWRNEDKPRYENTYREILNSGLSDKYENQKSSLSDRLKRLISG